MSRRFGLINDQSHGIRHVLFSSLTNGSKQVLEFVSIKIGSAKYQIVLLYSPLAHMNSNQFSEDSIRMV